MAKTNRKESRKIYEGYKKRQRLWNTIFIVFFAVIGIGSAVLNGTMELDPQIVIGKYEFTWFHLVILAVLVVLLGFGIVALKRDSSEEQQEIYRQEREEAIRLRQEVMAERNKASLWKSQTPDDALLSDEAFSVGKVKYETILVPNCLTLRSSTLERLKVFQKKGGRVVFLGELPRFIDAVTRCQIRIFPKEKTWLLK